ncbi:MULTISPECIES: hypothetical protein [unclassified Legionella]|uniref:hypothetical protein n=1 Tax=unclassified Legionella TaxID=2622702 RepID=UPI001E29DD35|nr:hypothetical protein [Legionella sp. 31fI33]MCC5015976.1 hypothetical protein [Legionella sp. 31fI33]
MSEKQAESDLSMWYSTYGLITAERILEKCKIKLPQEDLFAAVKNPNNFYHRLLRVPMKNVFNGIILQQAHDYQVYAQKLFVDYLLSGETAKDEESPGGLTRDDLEAMRKKLVEMGDEFHQLEFAQDKLIAESQHSLIKHASEWKKILQGIAKKIKPALPLVGGDKSDEKIIQAINHLIIKENTAPGETVSFKSSIWGDLEKILGQSIGNELKQLIVEELVKLTEFAESIEASLVNFIERVSDAGRSLRQYRTDFYNLILRVNELIQLLPEYRVNPEQTEENRESLYFDADLGEQ